MLTLEGGWPILDFAGWGAFFHRIDPTFLANLLLICLTIIICSIIGTSYICVNVYHPLRSTNCLGIKAFQGFGRNIISGNINYLITTLFVEQSRIHLAYFMCICTCIGKSSIQLVGIPCLLIWDYSCKVIGPFCRYNY